MFGFLWRWFGWSGGGGASPPEPGGVFRRADCRRVFRREEAGRVLRRADARRVVRRECP